MCRLSWVAGCFAAGLFGCLPEPSSGGGGGDDPEMGGAAAMGGAVGMAGAPGMGGDPGAGGAPGMGGTPGMGGGPGMGARCPDADLPVRCMAACQYLARCAGPLCPGVDGAGQEAAVVAGCMEACTGDPMVSEFLCTTGSCEAAVGTVRMVNEDFAALCAGEVPECVIDDDCGRPADPSCVVACARGQCVETCEPPEDDCRTACEALGMLCEPGELPPGFADACVPACIADPNRERILACFNRTVLEPQICDGDAIERCISGRPDPVPSCASACDALRQICGPDDVPEGFFQMCQQVCESVGNPAATVSCITRTVIASEECSFQAIVRCVDEGDGREG